MSNNTNDFTSSLMEENEALRRRISELEQTLAETRSPHMPPYPSSERQELTENQTGTLLELLCDITYVLDVAPDGTYTWSSGLKELEEFIGQKIVAPMPEAWKDISHADDSESIAQQFMNLAEGNIAINDYRLPHHSGEFRWVRDYASPIWDTHTQRVTRIYGAIKDITLLQEYEQAMQDSEERFRLATLATRDAIYDWDVESDIVWRNQAFDKLIGRKTQIAPQRTWWEERIHPQDHPMVLANFERILHEPVQLWISQYRFRRFDHTYATIVDRGYIVRDEKGKAVRLIGAMSDISERKDAEARQTTQLKTTRILAEAATAEEAIPHILETLCTGFKWQCGEMWRIDSTTEIIQCSHMWCEDDLQDSAFVAITPTLQFAKGESMPGRIWEQRRPSWHTIMNINTSCSRLEEANEANLHCCFAFPIGNQEACDGILAFYSYEERLVDAALFEMMTDVGIHLHQFLTRKRIETALHEEQATLTQHVAERTAELSLANAELARAVRTKDEFLATMSHELRTPLNAIIGLTESLQEYTYGSLNEKQLRALTTIESSGRHLLALINDILDISKIEAGKMEIHFDSVTIEDICVASLQFVRQQALKKHITIAYQNKATIKTFDADIRRLKQILVNLLTNAVKFTPEYGDIGLDVLHDSEQTTLTFLVWDTGIGISDEQKAHLFQPFFQIDSSLSREHEGTGLGLALVARLTELHGGSVEIDSEVGKGSRFCVHLPITIEGHINGEEVDGDENDAPQHYSSHSHAVRASKSATKRKEKPTILVAEDNESTITLLHDYLVRKGFQVLVARNGAEAVACMKESNAKLVLMDIQMPGMDGLEAIRQIRADTTIAQVPIIALTALAMAGDRERCLEAGASDYMTKPISLKSLLRAIQGYVRE